MIYGHSQSTGGFLQDDNAQNFDTRLDQVLLGKSEMPPESVLEGLYHNRLPGSEQLESVFAMYNQDLSRHHVTPGCR